MKYTKNNKIEYAESNLDAILAKGVKPKELEMIVSVPKCPCGKIPLKCPHPNNCLMENL